MDSSDDIAGDAPAEAPEPAQNPGDDESSEFRPQRRRRGPVFLALIIASATGRWQQRAFSEEPVAAVPEFALIGVVAARWRFVTVDKVAGHTESHWFRRAAAAQRGAVVGFVEYFTEDRVPMEPVQLDCGPVSGDILRAAGDTPVRDGTLAELLDRWGIHFGARLLTLAVVLGSCVAVRLITGHSNTMHVVPVSDRTPSTAWLEEAPGKRERAAFKREGRRFDPAAGSGDRRLLRRTFQHPQALHSAKTLIDFLRAARHIRKLKAFDEVATDFATLFANAGQIGVREVRDSMGDISRDILRDGRIRMDCVSMLIHRYIYKELVTNSNSGPFFFIFCDASPQARGDELFAAAFDTFADGAIKSRRTFPFLSACVGSDLIAKTLYLAWAAFLMVGPPYDFYRSFCSRVRSITSDFGVEKDIVNSIDVTDEIFKALGLRDVPISDDKMFKNAVHMPGFRHIFDGVLRRALSGLRWFPRWILLFKACVYFLRSRAVIRTLAREARRNNKHGYASLLESLKIPSFAKWRWCTLHDCMTAVGDVWNTFSMNFKPHLFKKSRQTTRLRRVTEAVQSAEFRRQWGVVAFIAEWLTKILRWCGGCSCCPPPESRHAERKSCPMIGRRLQEAYPVTSSALRDGLALAESWPALKFGDPSLLADAQGAVRCAYALALEKISFMEDIPYLAARIGDEGIAQKCLDQFDGAPVERQHPVSVRLFSAENGPTASSLNICFLVFDGLGIRTCARALPPQTHMFSDISSCSDCCLCILRHPVRCHGIEGHAVVAVRWSPVGGFQAGAEGAS